MRLFDKFKKEEKEEEIKFEYKIIDKFEIINRENTCVVIGNVLKGKAKAGDEVYHFDTNGEILFKCKIVGIEQGRDKCQVAKAPGMYGIMLEGCVKSQVEIDGMLARR